MKIITVENGYSLDPARYKNTIVISTGDTAIIYIGVDESVWSWLLPISAFDEIVTFISKPKETKETNSLIEAFISKCSTSDDLVKLKREGII